MTKHQPQRVKKLQIEYHPLILSLHLQSSIQTLQCAISTLGRQNCISHIYFTWQFNAHIPARTNP